jgi:hypothetical protein
VLADVLRADPSQALGGAFPVLPLR